MALVIPFVLAYLAWADADPFLPSDEGNSAEPGTTQLLPDDEDRPTTQPPRGLLRVQWHLRHHDVSWAQLWWTGTWAGLLFLAFNILWFTGLPMKVAGAKGQPVH